MKIIPIAFIIFLIPFNSIFCYKSKSKSEQCRVCRNLIDNFIKGFEKTRKGNFGGGNTDWEDRKLGSYVTSDIRFEEIIENACSSKENDCHHLLEEQEDNLLDWFKTKQKILIAELFSDICIDQAKFCCPSNTFGSDCRQCQQLKGQICSGNGNCDGEGTRDGSGKCKCNRGYAGELCSSCNDGFYQKNKNDTNTECAECYWSCLTCSGPEQNSCQSCKNGWKFNSETNLCDDINECLEDKKCAQDEFCENTQGSFVCQKCDAACQECSGPGADKCTGQCSKGYEKISDSCVDVNECEQDTNPCSSGECVNKPGSYQCQAKTDKNKNNKKQTNDLLVKRSFIIGVMILCMLSSYFAKQYFLTALSFLFGSLILFLLN